MCVWRASFSPPFVFFAADHHQDAKVKFASCYQPTTPMGNGLSGGCAGEDRPTKQSHYIDHTTLASYGHLCHSTLVHLLNHEELSELASLARVVHYVPGKVVYASGEPVGKDEALFLYLRR
jgi:hypothetical protein